MVENPTYKVYVKPYGPAAAPGDFDGDGILDENDPDHLLDDSDGDGIPDIYDVDEGWRPPVTAHSRMYPYRTFTYDSEGNAIGVRSVRYPPPLTISDTFQFTGEITYGVARGLLYCAVPIFTLGLIYGLTQTFIKHAIKKGA